MSDERFLPDHKPDYSYIDRTYLGSYSYLYFYAQ